MAALAEIEEIRARAAADKELKDLRAAAQVCIPRDGPKTLDFWPCWHKHPETGSARTKKNSAKDVSRAI